jgi:hypothetical protein
VQTSISFFILTPYSLLQTAPSFHVFSCLLLVSCDCHLHVLLLSPMYILLFFTVMYSTILYSTLLYSTLLYSTLLTSLIYSSLTRFPHNHSTRRIPLPSDIFEGHFLKTVCFLFELFDVYVSNGWGGWCGVRCRDMLVWYNRILSQYSRALNNNALGCEGINSGAGAGGGTGGGRQGCQSDKLISPQHHFRTGTDLFCVIYHFYGPALLHPAPSLPSRPLLVDPSRMYFEPLTMSELRANVSYVFNLLEVLGVDVIWTVDEWVSLDDQAFCILQLSKVYAHCKDRRCAVPLADPVTAAPGLTSGPLGLPLVVGLVFADTPPPPPPSTSTSNCHSGARTDACTSRHRRAHTRGCNQVTI